MKNLTINGVKITSDSQHLEYVVDNLPLMSELVTIDLSNINNLSSLQYSRDVIEDFMNNLKELQEQIKLQIWKSQNNFVSLSK